MGIISALEFWNTVKQMIRDRGYTQEDFCAECGFVEGSFKNRMSKNLYPTLDVTIIMASVLDCSIDALAGMKEIPADIIDLAFEINALPAVYRQIVMSTLETLKNAATAQDAGAERSSFRAG